MVNLHAIFCKSNVNSNKLSVLLEPHSSFQFQYRLLTMTTFFEIAVFSQELMAVLDTQGESHSG